jgi:hypothetical protein
VERLKFPPCCSEKCDENSKVGDDYATFVTTDPEVAKKFGMEEEREYLDEEDDEDQTRDEAT